LKKIDDAVEILKALGDGTRFRIIALLASSGNNLCVNALSQRLDVAQPVVSQHLRVLKNAGIVTASRMGYHIHYSVDTRVIQELRDRIDELIEISPGEAAGGCSARPGRTAQRRKKS
jgi:ArsR family transcriptional regulator, arsenate/arsenite/antimonite-responsive transcriptional repressor